MKYTLTIVYLFASIFSYAQVSGEFQDIKSTTLAGSGDRQVVADPDGVLKIGPSILPTDASTGDMIIFDGTSWQNLPVGTEGQILTIRNGIPTWDTGMTNPPDTTDNPNPPNANLLFASGFGGTTALSDVYQGYQRLTGFDPDTGFEWIDEDNGLWGSSNNGIHLINDTDMENELQIVPDRNGEDTQALYQYIGSTNGGSTQTPYQINNIVEDPDEYYVKFWIKMDNTSLQEDDKYRVIWQYKSDRFDYQHPERGFRISLYVYTDEDGAYWHVRGDDQKYKYWSQSNRDLPVPREEWFQVEVYSKVSSDSDGLFWAKINGVEIASHEGKNLGSAEDTMDFMMLWQLYGDSYPSHQWIDDVEIWDGIPY